MPMATVNLTSDNYDSQLADILRRQKYAELLAQQGNEDIKVENVNGVPTPISPFQGLAKVFQSGMGAYLAGQSSKDKATLDKTTSERLSDALANYGRPNTGANVGTVDTSGIEGAGQSFPITGMVTGPATQNDKMQRASAMMGMGDIGKVIGGELLKQSVEPEKLYTLNRGDTLQTGTGQVRGVGAPPAPANKTPFAAVGPDGKPGMFVYDETGKIVPVPGMTPFRTGGNGGENTKLSTDDLDFMARQALTGDTSVFAGLGYGSAGAQNRSLLRSKITQVAKEQGIKPADVAALNAQFFGTKAGERTLGTRTANIGMAVAEATQLMPLALAASEKVNRTQFPTLNSILMAGEKGVGDENVVRLGIATNSLINTYARAINPTGIPTVSDKDHARELLENAWSKGQYAAGVNQLKLEMDAAKQSPGIVRQEFRTSISGTTPATGGAAAPGAGGYATKEAAEADLKAKGHKPGESVKVTINGQTGTMVLH